MQAQQVQSGLDRFPTWKRDLSDVPPGRRANAASGIDLLVETSIRSVVQNMQPRLDWAALVH